MGAWLHDAVRHIIQYLHLNELFVVVFTEVVHQLHGHGLAAGGIGAFAWLLNSSCHHVAQDFLATSCTLEDCGPAFAAQL